MNFDKIRCSEVNTAPSYHKLMRLLPLIGADYQLLVTRSRAPVTRRGTQVFETTLIDFRLSE